MKRLIVWIGVCLVVACAQQPLTLKAPTAECMQYQQMQTAPMPSEAIEQLRLKCLKSQGDDAP